MTDSDYAAGQLRVIRALMERATIYRSISAPTALVGGLLSMAGFGIAWWRERHLHWPFEPGAFLEMWLTILGLTVAANFLFLWRGSARRGEPFLSPGMRLAMASLAPAFLAAGLLTLLVHRPIHLAIGWLLLYGIGLLATQHFAPRSLVLLGVAFFLAGAGLAAGWKSLLTSPEQPEPTALLVSGIMAATFGGFHLAYAALVWLLREDEAGATDPPGEATHV